MVQVKGLSMMIDGVEDMLDNGLEDRTGQTLIIPSWVEKNY